MAKESINISNIPVVGRAPEDYLKLAEFLKEKDYVIRYDVSDLAADKHIPAVMIDTIDHTASITSGMIMACWCTGGRQPISVATFIELYEEIVIKQDHKLYKSLVDKSYNIYCN